MQESKVQSAFQMRGVSQVKNPKATATWPDSDKNDNRLSYSYKSKYYTLCKPPKKLHEPLPKKTNWSTGAVLMAGFSTGWCLRKAESWFTIQNRGRDWWCCQVRTFTYHCRRCYPSYHLANTEPGNWTQTTLVESVVVLRWERSAPTNVIWIRFPDSVSYVGWVCYFSSLLWEVFPRVLPGNLIHLICPQALSFKNLSCLNKGYYYYYNYTWFEFLKELHRPLRQSPTWCHRTIFPLKLFCVVIFIVHFWKGTKKYKLCTKKGKRFV